MTEAPFRFRLERVRAVRERSEKLAQQELAEAISRRAGSEADLRAAEGRLQRAQTEQRTLATESPTLSAAELQAQQAFIEQAERERGSHAGELSRREADVAGSDSKLAIVAGEHEMLNRLRERQRGEHEREVANRERDALDEIAVTRFGRSAA